MVSCCDCVVLIASSGADCMRGSARVVALLVRAATREPTAYSGFGRGSIPGANPCVFPGVSGSKPGIPGLAMPSPGLALTGPDWPGLARIWPGEA